ncbi:hypothetical protein ACJX0J_002708, partial [Zea mays]
EIPLLLTLFYLFRGSEAGHRPSFWLQGPASPGRSGRKTLIQASNRRLCSPPAPTHVRAFAPQGPVPLAQPARPTRRGGPPRSSLPNGRRAESFADDLKRDGALQNSPKSWEG